MTARTVNEWIGKTPETAIPPRVKDRILQRQADRCKDCLRPFNDKVKPQFDHRPALVNSGENRESKIDALCALCHRPHTTSDVAEKSKVAEIRKKRFGLKQAKRPFPGSRASNWKRKLSGEVVRR